MHVATVVYDPYVSIRWVDAVVPFLGSYRPFWLGLGGSRGRPDGRSGATSLLRHRIRRRAWRAVHWAAYACWPVALAHGVGTGSDLTAALGLGVAGRAPATAAAGCAGGAAPALTAARRGPI